MLNPLNATPRDATLGKPETFAAHYEVISLSKKKRPIMIIEKNGILYGSKDNENKAPNSNEANK